MSLAEGIIGKQDIITGHECRHAVRPMEHFHLHKHQLFAVANVYAVAGLDHMEIPAALAILALDALYRLSRAIDGGIRNLVHQCGQRAGMIAFAVIGDDDINLMKVDFLFQILHKIKTMGCPYGVDQDRLFLFDQVSVLAEPFMML